MRKGAMYVSILFLIALALVMSVAWYKMFTNNDPLGTTETIFINENGERISEARVGEQVRIERTYKVKGRVEFKYFPTLIGSDGTIYPLPSGVFVSEEGHHVIYTFTVPSIPVGDYAFRTTVSYQDGIVKDNRIIVLPVAHLRIIQ